jgi:uncharacterized protein YhaN
MRITDIEIDGFGVWKDLQIGGLPEGVTVFFGPNEAGKTTVMQFVRTVLYGFSCERRSRYLPPLFGGNAGGRLRVDAGGAAYLLERRAGPEDGPADAGSLAVIDVQGRPRDAGQLETLLAGIDEPTFSNVFACGLREIQELGTLDDTTAADLLYKLTTGLDRVSLVDVIRHLQVSREELLSTAERPSRIPELLARRRQLADRVESLSAGTRRYSELAEQRDALAAEAIDLQHALERTEEHHRRLKAALDVLELWNSRAAVDQQLERLRDIPQLPNRAVERMGTLRRRVRRAKRKLRALAAQRKKLRREALSLEINKQVLNHATRIEALTDQAQWLATLDAQIKKLRAEIERLDGEIQQQVGGIQGKISPEEISQEAFAALRRPGMLLREQTEQLDRARQECDAANLELEHAASKYAAAAKGRRPEELQQALAAAGQKVALLRRRVQIEERIDELTRRRQELEFAGDEIDRFEGLPLRYTVALAIVFSLGFMLLSIGLVGTWQNWIASATPYWLFGCLFTFGSAVTKLVLERRTDENLSDNQRDLDRVRGQLADIKKERDEIDAELPTGGGALDVRLREAEAELREIQRLMPLAGERAAAEQKAEAAQRKLTAAQEAFKTARHRWREALRGVGLPEDFAPQKVRHVVRSGDAVVELRRRREIRRDELEQREREMLAMASRVQQLLADCRLTPKSDDAQEQLRQLGQTLAHEKEVLALRDGTLRAARKLRRERARLVHAIRQACRRRSALLATAGVADMVAFRQVAADTAKAQQLRQERDEWTAKITAALAGRYSEAEIAGVMAADGPDLRARWDQRGTHVAELRSRLASLHERRGACTYEMQQLAADRRLSETQMELAIVGDELRQAMRRWQVLALVAQALDVVRRKYETERQPETLKQASIYLRQLTLGQYGRIWMPLDRRALLVEDAAGRSLSLEVLSRGTREAIYISLRLALAASFGRRGAQLPLVFDDVLVNLDQRRVEAAAKVFREFAVDGRQIFLFTCHEHITRVFEAAQVEVRQLPERAKSSAPSAQPRRRRKEATQRPAAELPPPPPPPVVHDEESDAPRHAVDPNALLACAAAESEVFDPTNLAEIIRMPRAGRKKPAPALAPRIAPPPAAVSVPPQPTEPPPPPLREVAAPPRPVARLPQRFTWESPEMYWQDRRVDKAPVGDDAGIPDPHFGQASTAQRPASAAVPAENPADDYPPGWHF